MTLDRLLTEIQQATQQKPYRQTAAVLIYADTELYPEDSDDPGTLPNAIARHYLLIQTTKWPPEKWGMLNEGQRQRDGCLENTVLQGIREELGLTPYEMQDFSEPVYYRFIPPKRRGFSSESARNHPRYGQMYSGKEIRFLSIRYCGDQETLKILPGSSTAEIRETRWVTEEELLRTIRPEEREPAMQIIRTLPKPELELLQNEKLTFGVPTEYG